ncbi:Gustatory receptor 132 [Halyomorpha halys]|nr:Gustatory receptor 132 [Halyomorpha halys]
MDVMVRTAWEVRHSFIDDGFHQIFKMPRIVGNFPLSKEYKFSPWRFILSSILLGFSGFKILNAFLKCLKFVTIKNIFLLFWAIICWCLIGIILTTLSWPVMKATELQAIRMKLKEIEQVIRKFVPLRKKIKWYELHLCFVIYSILIACFCCSDLNIFFLLSFIILDYNATTVISQTCGFLALNGVLLSKIKYIRNIDVQVKLVNDITIVLKWVNDYNGFRLFLVTTGLTVRLVNSIYVIPTDGFTDFNTFLFLTTIIFFGYFVFLILSTNRIKNKIDKMNQYFNEKLEADQNNEMIDFYLISKKGFSFTACGFFNYDQNLISRMIVVSITYAVILLQQNTKYR